MPEKTGRSGKMLTYDTVAISPPPFDRKISRMTRICDIQSVKVEVSATHHLLMTTSVATQTTPIFMRQPTFSNSNSIWRVGAHQ